MLLTGGAIFAVSTLGASSMVEDLSAGLIEQTSDHTNTELRRFIAPVERAVTLARSWGDSGLLKTGETIEINKLLIPLLESAPHISSVMIANSDGLERLILRQPDGTWVTRVIRIDAWADMSVWTTWSTPTELENQRYELVASYDPRQTDWYRGAVALSKSTYQGIYWTAPYPLFTTQQPGISAAAALRTTPDDPRTWVVAFDVPVEDISVFTTQLSPSKRGKAVIFSDDGRILGLPDDEKFRTYESRQSSILRPVMTVDVPEVRAAFSVFEQLKKGKGEHERSITPFELDGDVWWAGFEPFDIGRALRVWIAIVVPESDIVGSIESQRVWIVIISLLALGLALALVFLFARNYSQPLEALAAQSGRIGHLDLQMSAPVASKLTEIQTLSNAQAQMLAALQSFSRYVPVDVVRELVAQGEVAKIGGRTADLTILFTDIRGFTSIAESMEPQALASHMAEYFEALLDVLTSHGATVDKFVGDAIVAFWGAPAENPDHARAASRCTLELVATVRELNTRWKADGKPVLETTFGLHSGSVVVGNIGAPDRLAYTVIGDTVNVASRIEGLNRRFETTVLASDAVRRGYTEGNWRRVGRVEVRGRREALDVFELRALNNEAGGPDDRSVDGQPMQPDQNAS